MAHERVTIRSKLKILLSDAAMSGIGSNVFNNRFRPVWENSELPCVVIWTRDEDSEIFTVAPKRYQRKTRVVVELLAKANETLDDALDNFADTIEDLIAVSAGLANPLGITAFEVDGVDLVGTDMEIETGGDTLIGSLKMTFEVTWYRWAPKQQSLDDFDGGDFELDVTGDNDNEEKVEGSFTIAE